MDKAASKYRLGGRGENKSKYNKVRMKIPPEAP